MKKRVREAEQKRKNKETYNKDHRGEGMWRGEIGEKEEEEEKKKEKCRSQYIVWQSVISLALHQICIVLYTHVFVVHFIRLVRRGLPNKKENPIHYIKYTHTLTR